MNTFFSIWAGQMGRSCALLGRYVQLVNSELEVSDKLGGSYPLLLGADTVPEPFRNRSVVLASPNGSRTVPERSQNGPRTVSSSNHRGQDLPLSSSNQNGFMLICIFFIRFFY